MRSCFVKDFVDKGELCVFPLPWGCTISRHSYQSFSRPRHQLLKRSFGLKPPAPKNIRAAAVDHRPVSTTSGNPEAIRLRIWALVTWLQVMICSSAEDDDSKCEPAPIGPELSMMVLMLKIFRFVCFSGKQGRHA